MPTSYGALCSDFYINSKLSVKMDLPASRETVLEMFERIRREFPAMRRFRRFENELALETPTREDGQQRWVALQRTSVRIGTVNPESLADGYRLHETVLGLAPFYLSINPLDVAAVEVVFGFDLEAAGNHHAIIHDALLAGSSLARLIDEDHLRPIELQPFIGASLTDRGDLKAFFEVKARSGPVRGGRSASGGGPDRHDPLSVYVTMRKQGLGPDDMAELPKVFTSLCEHAERLTEERAIPHILTPLREAIASRQY